MALYLRHPASLDHDTGPHPENAARVRAIETELERRGWFGLEVVEAPRATREQLLRVHDEAHVERIERLCAQGGGMIDVDTVVSEGSWEAALRAAGGAAEAAARLLSGDGGVAFCGLRPPGHHAERARAMGFCLLNNVAVAVAHALGERGAERALVLDWDVHHGNGTEEIFARSDRVLYASIHQSPLYPGTGDAGEVGVGAGEGFTVNLPVKPGAGREEFLSLVQHVVAPIARAHRPDLICVSAGYDAHRSDPLAQCRLETSTYGELATAVRSLAAELDAPVLACLEGGYELEALAASVAATIAGLTGDADPGAAPETIAAPYLERQRRYWPV